MDPLVAEAARYAARRHQGQTRKDGVTPYVVHPQRVAERLRSLGVERPEVLAAAWLHDVIEDTGGTYDEIASAFGHEVADLVEAVTRRPGITRREFTERLYDCPPQALLIRLADRLDNLEDWSGMESGFRGPYTHEALRMVHWARRNPRRNELPANDQVALSKLEAALRRKGFRGASRRSQAGGS